jgi:PAS domain S-box-containing protein
LRFYPSGGRSQLSLRSKLVFGGILIMLIPTTIFGTVTFLNSTSTLEKIYRLQLIQVSKSFSGMIQISLEKDVKSLTKIARDPQVVKDVLAGDFTRIQTKLAELYKLVSADFEGVALLSVRGEIVADGADANRVGISIAERRYFQMARQGKTGFGPIVRSKVTGAPIFGMCAPIMSPVGDFIGAILGVVKVDYLFNFISSIELGKTGYVFMIDQTGAIISHPNHDLFLTTNIKKIAQSQVFADLVFQQKQGVVEYIYRGVEKIAGISPIRLTGWSIAACQDRDEIMALAYSNMNFLLMVISFLIVLIIIAVLIFSLTVSTPVQTTLITLNHAIDQAAEAFLILSREGEVQFANPAAAAIIDQPVSEMVGNPFKFANASKDNGRKIIETMKQGAEWSGRMDGVRGDNSKYTMALTLSPVTSPNGKFMCYLAVGRDITEELSLHEKFQQSQKMEAIGTLVGGISHDFNNILSAIFGYTELGLKSLDNRKNLKSHLNRIMEAAERARDLVAHILTFSRKTDLDQTPLIPKYVVKGTLKLLRASLPSTIEIKESLNSSAVVMGNETQLHQMIMNLCSNAGYEMRKSGGVLKVSLDEIAVDGDMRRKYPDLNPSKYLRIKVADTGGGIPADTLERIFDPFFTTKPTGEGTGLGLSVVHGIVKSLSGEIMVASEMGKGSTFTILLPILEKWMLPEDDLQRKELLGGNERILLVEDEDAIAQSMKIILEDIGYAVRLFTQSMLAWEELSSHVDAYDIVITDYTMPQLTGVDLSKMIRGIHSDIPIILCSGYLDLDENLEQLKPIELLKKPFTSHELTQALRHALDQRGQA